MSMVGGTDHETRSYLEIADAIQRHGAAPNADLHELWRRIVFSVLISNTDDHLRNHGFLYEGNQGWRLSPAYDLNPVPVQFRPRILSTLIDEQSGEASIELALSVAGYFRLTSTQARQTAWEVAQAVSGWSREAAALGISAAESERVASAFEHEDLAAPVAAEFLGPGCLPPLAIVHLESPDMETLPEPKGEVRDPGLDHPLAVDPAALPQVVFHQKYRQDDYTGSGGSSHAAPRSDGYSEGGNARTAGTLCRKESGHFRVGGAERGRP